jgi:serine/threonine protein kinase
MQFGREPPTMAAPLSINELLDITQKSGVVDENRLKAYVQQFRNQNTLPKEPSKLAGLMVRDGLLTLFQAEQLLLGKWKRFTIGKYKVLERLGTGGMGQVFLCEHKMMKRRVAVKVLPTAKAEEHSSLERFYREARVVASLDHVNIVRAYDIDQDDNLHFLVMEFVDGPNLQDVIKKHGPMDWLRVCHYIRQAALGLQHAFDAAGVLHRDIKPGNILIDRQGVVKILDMGLARFFHDEEDLLTKQYDETVLGTADYLAPEQAIDSHNVDIRADIYSLGATFYFMLTGNPPFPDGTVAQKLMWHNSKDPAPIQSLRPEVPANVAAIVEKMMAKDKNARYQKPAEVAAALEAITVTPIGPPPDVEMPRWSPAAMGVAGPASPTTVGPRASSTSIIPPQAQRPAAPAAPPPPSPAPVLPPAPPAPAAPRSTTKAPPVTATPLFPPLTPASPLSTTPAIRSSQVETAEAPPIWASIAADTPHPALSVTGTQKSKALGKVPTGRHRTAERLVHPRAKRRMRWVLFSLAGVVLGGLTVALLMALGAFGNRGDRRPENPPPPPAPQRLVVDTSASANASSQKVALVLMKARPGDHIIVRGPAVEEAWGNVANARIPAGITIEAEIPQMPWRLPASATDSKAVFTAANMDGIKLKGFVFDGQGRAENGIYVTGHCPGVTFEDCVVQNCKDAAVKLSNAAGDEGKPIRFVNSRLHGGATVKGVVYLFAAPNLTSNKANGHVVLENCKLDGPGSALVLVEGSADALTFSNLHLTNATNGLVFRPLKDTRWAQIAIQDNSFARIGGDAMQIDTSGATIDAKTFAIRDNHFSSCKNVLTSVGTLPKLLTEGNVRDAASGEGNGGLVTKIGEVRVPANPLR